MTDMPIIFSARMVQALLAGRKTQTRRLLRIRGHKAFSHFGVSDTRGYDWHFRDAEKRWRDLRHAELLTRLPWHVGDRLWVRETWAPYGMEALPIEERPIFYRADPDDAPGWMTPPDIKWRSSIHMPRWASRLTLIVIAVRVQRLRDMLLNDYEAEGVVNRSMSVDEAIHAFASLWNSIHGFGAWDANPDVIALTFTVAQRNINA